MAGNGTITSANVTLALGATGVFSTPQVIQSFSMDDIFDHEMTDWAEVQLGADGIGVAGWVPRLNKQTITLLPSSASVLFFETVQQAQDGGPFGNGPDVVYLFGSLRYPSIGRRYTLNQGVITRGAAAPSAKKVLVPRQFEITWMPPQQGVPAIFGQAL